MIQVDFGPYKDTFGYNNFQSFIDHVDHYQYSQQLQHSTDTIKFQFNNSGIPIFDIFEIETSAKHNLNFKNVNVIVVETFRQFLSILNKLDKSKKYIVLSESYWDTNGYQIDLNYELIFVPWDLIDCQNRLTNRSNLYFYLYDLDFFTKGYFYQDTGAKITPINCFHISFILEYFITSDPGSLRNPLEQVLCHEFRCLKAPLDRILLFVFLWSLSCPKNAITKLYESYNSHSNSFS